MATAYKTLGQAIPAAGVLTNLAAPVGVSHIISTLECCNQGSTAAKIRVSVAVAGAADEAKQYIVKDFSVPAYMPWPFTHGITLATTDVLRVQSDTGLVSFTAFGAEIT